jgi:lysophospholipase L1-like esterase
MSGRLLIVVCAAVAVAFVFGYKLHGWRYPPIGLDHYSSRKDAILAQVRQNRSYDYAIIGNSITEHTYVPSLCGKSVFNAGIGGARIHDAAGLMAELSPILRANTIILEIGINDAITTQKRSDTIRADFERLVRLAKDTGAEVFTSTVGPVDITKPEGAARDLGLINAINAQIRASTEDNRLIDLNANLKADDTMDGVHLTEAGTRRWRSAIEAAVCPSWSSAHAVPVIQIPQ